MKKKLLTTLSVVLILGLAALGILAYLTDTDSDVNVMTLGNVEIEQIEQERAENGTIVDFTQDKPAYPAVGPIEWAASGVSLNGTEYKVFTNDLKNVVDKFVTVENKGKSDAFVRTLVAIEAPNYDPTDLIHINYNGSDTNISSPVNIEIDGVKYVVFEFTYKEAVKSKAVSAPSLMQVFLDSKTTNEDCAKFGNTWEIVVLSQAVQTAGFDDAQTALDEAFGETSDNAANWFKEVLTAPVSVDTVDELTNALESGKNVELTEDVAVTEPIEIPAGEEVTIDLQGNKLSTTSVALFEVSGENTVLNIVSEEATTIEEAHIAVTDGATVTVDNVIVKSKTDSASPAFNIVSGTVCFQAGEIVCQNKNSAAVFLASTQSGGEAKFIMNSGKITADQGYAIFANSEMKEGAGTTIQLNNGDVSGDIYLLGGEYVKLVIANTFGTIDTTKITKVCGTEIVDDYRENKKL